MFAAWIVTGLHLVALCHASCYFSTELQGEYVMQTITAGAQVQYSQVMITAEAIPMWGLCHLREGNNVILNDSFNGTACIRCFHLKLHSPNVLQVHTCPTCLDQCYVTEEAARNTCPTGHDFSRSNFKEITLFRTKELGGGNIRKMFCPITGLYTFTYNLFNQTDNRIECSPAISRLENCADPARGPQLAVHFQGCSQQYNEMTFDCLGEWAGPQGQRFLALYDTSISGSTEHRPQYRCALYREDDQRGNIMMAFSSDSTCTTDLYNASYGHMTWNLTAVPSMPWPLNVINSKCSFPLWSQGKWENFNVNYNSITYKDHISFNTYTMRCAQPVDNERFIVFSKNGCGEAIFKCIRLKHRSGNVIEFQIGLTSSAFANSSLCSDSNFLGNVWVTQARLEGLQVSPCPVTGEYSGVIPNNTNMCARLASDSLHQEIMYFIVSDCEQHEIYEGRYLSGRHKREDEESLLKVKVDETMVPATSTEALPLSLYSSVSEVPATSSVTVDPVSEGSSTLETTAMLVVSPTTPSTTVHQPAFPVTSNTEQTKTTEAYKPQIFTTVDDSEQVESSVNEKTRIVGNRPYFVVKYNTASTVDQNPGTEAFPVTYRPHRSFQPQNPWATPPPLPWAVVNNRTTSPHIPATTLPWYSIHNGRNLSSPQMSAKPNYVQHSRPSDMPYNKVATEFPFRDHYTDNYRGGMSGGSYDRRDWSNRDRQFGETNSGRNNWSTNIPGRGGYDNPHWSRTSNSFAYHRPDITSRNNFNVTNRPDNYRVGGEWNYQNTRQNWNWDGRYRTSMGFPYRPYQNTKPNYRQPIALPPIQLPPLYPDMNRPMQGASTVVRQPLVREEREYQCLGQWEEDGLTYTYTQRKDFGSYECFVGSIVSNNEIYIKEAGEHCGRGIDPLRLGMKLQTKVDNRLPELNPAPTQPTTSWYVTKRPSAPTKPWKPITAPPRHSGYGRTVPACFLVATLATFLSLRC